MRYLEIERDAGVNSEVNFYQLLGLEPTDSQQSIRESYIRAKDGSKNSSDAFYSITGDGEMRRYQELIEVAFKTLSDEKSKKIYDQRMSVVIGDQTEEKLSVAKAQYKPISKKIVDGKLLSEFKQILDDQDIELGLKLQKIRELSGYSRSDVWQKIKVSVDYVEYFETNKFEKLPAIVYSKGLLKSYCDFLCIPSRDAFIEKYIEELKNYREDV